MIGVPDPRWGEAVVSVVVLWRTIVLRSTRSIANALQRRNLDILRTRVPFIQIEIIENTDQLPADRSECPDECVARPIPCHTLLPGVIPPLRELLEVPSSALDQTHSRISLLMHPQPITM